MDTYREYLELNTMWDEDKALGKFKILISISKYKNKFKDRYYKIQRILLFRNSVTVLELFSQISKVIFIGNRHFLEKKKLWK